MALGRRRWRPTLSFSSWANARSHSNPVRSTDGTLCLLHDKSQKEGLEWTPKILVRRAA